MCKPLRWKTKQNRTVVRDKKEGQNGEIIVRKAVRESSSPDHIGRVNSGREFGFHFK